MAASRNIRRDALSRLALLSTASGSKPGASADIEKLSQSIALDSHTTENKTVLNGTDNTSVGRVPMTIRELEVLLALCNAAPSIADRSSATRLLEQLCPYLSESCYQALSSSPFLRHIDPSPWEMLSYSLATAVFKIGINHQGLHEQASGAISSYLDSCKRLTSYVSRPRLNDDGLGEEFGKEKETFSTITLTTSMLGFLRAATENTSFWDLAQRRGIIHSLQNVLTDSFFVAIEGAFSSIRNSRSGNRNIRDAKQYLRHYATLGSTLGATFVRQRFMGLVQACASLLIDDSRKLQGQTLLELFMLPRGKSDRLRATKDDLASEYLANVAAEEIQRLDEGSDYVHIGSAWQQQLANRVKANCLVTLVCCCIANEDVAEPDTIVTWLEEILGDPVQAADEDLAAAALQSLAALANVPSLDASKLSRALHRLLVRGTFSQSIAVIAAECLTFVLRFLPQDTVITTLYGLGNALTAPKSGEGPIGSVGSLGSPDLAADVANQRHMNGHVGLDSSLDLAAEDSDQLSQIHSNVIVAVVTVAKGFHDEKITALTLSMLVQKVNKISVPLDLKIITEAARLAVDSATGEFRALLRLYSRLSHDALRKNDIPLLKAVSGARDYMSTTLKGGTEVYEIYLRHLLETIISKGDAPTHDHKYHKSLDWDAEEIASLLRPLALLVASNVSTQGIEDTEHFATLQRDAWYNVVVHGFSPKSAIGRRHLDELKILAQYTQGLISEERADILESDIALNTVLRRGSHSQSVDTHRKEMIELLPQCEADIKDLHYPELMLLRSAYLVEILRASSGNCTTILSYFVDPDLRGALGNCMTAVALASVDAFLANTISGNLETFSAPFAAQQLAVILERCCHRVERVQQVAYLCADRVINQVPSALCHRTSIFALLDLLTIMWSSCLESETDEYEWKSNYTSPQGSTSVQLSDDFNFRRQTLRTFHKRAREWVTKAVNISPLDIKGLLQTYLSDYGDDDAFGHMSLGRSFAFEMGAKVPLTDQRLGAIETEQDLNINTASDFMAQYTSRQEYRFTDPTRTNGSEMDAYSSKGPLTRATSSGQEDEIQDIVSALARMEKRIRKKDHGGLGELRELLRRAAALLCGATDDQSTALSYFVSLPFEMFSKRSIKLGVSLWMGVIKENPRTECRILIEIFEGWIWTIRAKLGLFSDALKQSDPFYLKEEFAPSDKEMISKQQQHIHDRIAPHFRLLQFLASHYTATRMSSPSIENAYHRFLKVTLRALRFTYSHPLAREVHFHIIWLALRFLKQNTHLARGAQWRLKDDILSAGLAWFRQPPRWTFGGNRVQVKAETHLLSDVATWLHNVTDIGLRGTNSLRSLQQKQQLLQHLITNEQTRLMVWLFPMDHSQRHLFTSGQQGKASDYSRVESLLQTAWDEDPGIAVQIPTRFQSQALSTTVRNLVVKDTLAVLREPDALDILLGSALPNDVTSQLKYLLYWAPMNPIAAATLFLPAYKNHPYIIQYAVRALESHAVDITFFYVPQIVQMLRYDMLRYVERYIIETAKLSQLFAHQIIWNMKANAYKETNDGTEVADPIKPLLDRVTNSLISSFSDYDRDFYEREFNFFNEVTSISGKLKPFIGKSKQEKRQKIEEELRLIQVDVGVYLPSNPDGVVVGIDRKSGRPLQSHAKAPFMATFRIKKEKIEEDDAEDAVDTVNGGDHVQPFTRKASFEVWQSAIFKVGDDCRQDVLALQLIAAFRGIFHHVGLPVYVFPYRVTATAPGCGVIDVLPASISRDMLGREAVNGLYEWFRSKFGGEDAAAFQVARANFVKSLAAYSVISYLLQFKDRHNGNIMFDEQGHILHIDFGFCFDIAPGGVAFERAPFKLTKEMVAVMGGRESQSFRWFEELCVKAFLASRPFASTLSQMVAVMVDSGLPCFKPETIQHLHERFVLDKSEKEAAEFMLGLVDKSFASIYTKGYDWFQLKTNGIPY